MPPTAATLERLGNEDGGVYTRMDVLQALLESQGVTTALTATLSASRTTPQPIETHHSSASCRLRESPPTSRHAVLAFHHARPTLARMKRLHSRFFGTQKRPAMLSLLRSRPTKAWLCRRRSWRLSHRMPLRMPPSPRVAVAAAAGRNLSFKNSRS